MNEIPENQILEGDCLELFEQMPEDSVDMTFADPPFNLKKKYTSYKDSLELREYIKWCEKWISEMVRVTKPTGSIFLHNIPKWLTYYASHLNKIADFKHWISWEAPTAPMGKSLQPNHYGIYFILKNKEILKFMNCAILIREIEKKVFYGKTTEARRINYTLSDL